MRASTFLTSMPALAHLAAAWPGMANIRNDLAADAAMANGSTQLLGDLLTTPRSQWSPVGELIAEVLLGELGLVGTLEPYFAPPLGSRLCSLDTCCVWSYVVKDLVSAYTLADGKTPNDLARAAIRLMFHDAANWELGAAYGGADGSVLLNDEELERPVSGGLAKIAKHTQAVYAKYAKNGIGMADLIQVAGSTACALFPGAATFLTFVGRIDDARVPPDLLPLETDSARTLVDLFLRKSINAYDLVALTGAHSIGQQFLVDPIQAGKTFDSTPGVWDAAFFRETKKGKAPFMLQSDVALSKYRGDGILDWKYNTAQPWDMFSVGLTVGQDLWDFAFPRAWVRLSMLGVNNINNLTDCTKVLPKNSGAPPMSEFPPKL